MLNCCGGQKSKIVPIFSVIIIFFEQQITPEVTFQISERLNSVQIKISSIDLELINQRNKNKK